MNHNHMNVTFDDWSSSSDSEKHVNTKVYVHRTKILQVPKSLAQYPLRLIADSATLQIATNRYIMPKTVKKIEVKNLADYLKCYI